MTIALIVYVVGFLLTYRRTFRLSYERTRKLDSLVYDRDRSQSGRFWLALLWFGPFFALVWPLYWPATLVEHSKGDGVERVAKIVGGEDPGVKRRRKAEEQRRALNEAEDKARERERYIDTLERELKIGPYKEADAA